MICIHIHIYVICMCLCLCVRVCVCVCGFSGTIDKILTFEVTNFKVMITFL